MSNFKLQGDKAPLCSPIRRLWMSPTKFKSNINECEKYRHLTYVENIIDKKASKD